MNVMKTSALWMSCFWTLASIVAAGEPFHRVVVPVGPNNPRNSEAAIIPLKDGSLLLGWTEFYAGNGADHGPARISGKRSQDAGRTWGEKYTLVENDGGCNVMEVNFLRLGDGRIALFYCQKNSESKDCRVMMRTSSDEGRTFGESPTAQCRWQIHRLDQRPLHSPPIGSHPVGGLGRG